MGFLNHVTLHILKLVSDSIVKQARNKQKDPDLDKYIYTFSVTIIRDTEFEAGESATVLE